MCIYRRGRCGDDDGNRLQLLAGVDGLGNDEELMLLVVYGANTANYRCWNLQGMEKNIDLELASTTKAVKRMRMIQRAAFALAVTTTQRWMTNSRTNDHSDASN